MSLLLTFLAVGIGGALGSACRAWVISAFEARCKHWLMRGALVANVVSCFLAGLCLGLALSGLPQMVLMVGFFGGLSTLSTVNLDAAGSFLSKRYGRCFAYLLVTYGATLAVVLAGFALGQSLL